MWPTVGGRDPPLRPNSMDSETYTNYLRAVTSMRRLCGWCGRTRWLHWINWLVPWLDWQKAHRYSGFAGPATYIIDAGSERGPLDFAHTPLGEPKGSNVVEGRVEPMYVPMKTSARLGWTLLFFVGGGLWLTWPLLIWGPNNWTAAYVLIAAVLLVLSTKP